MRSSSFHLPKDLVGMVVQTYLERAVLPLLQHGGYGEKRLSIAVALKTARNEEYAGPIVQLDYTFDNRPNDDRYALIAEAKCELSFEFEKSTREVIGLEPNRLVVEDVVHPGGIFYRGIAVGVSGLANWDDEAIALQVAAEIWRFGMANHSKRVAQGIDFLMSDKS